MGNQYKIYCVEGPDESCLFDDPEKPYDEEDIDPSEDITQKINVDPDDEDDDDNDELEDEIDESEDTLEDEVL